MEIENIKTGEIKNLAEAENLPEGWKPVPGDMKLPGQPKDSDILKELGEPFLTISHQVTNEPMVKLFHSGEVWMGPRLSMNEVAQLFWRTVGDTMPWKQMVRGLQEHNQNVTKRLTEVEAELKQLRAANTAQAESQKEKL